MIIKTLFSLITAICCLSLYGQDTTKRTVQIATSSNMDPECSTKKNGNILFINNSKYKLNIIVEKTISGNNYNESKIDYTVTVNSQEESPLMGIGESSYSFRCMAYNEDGRLVNGSYYSGQIQIFKCKETNVKIK